MGSISAGCTILMHYRSTLLLSRFIIALKRFGALNETTNLLLALCGQPFKVFVSGS